MDVDPMTEVLFDTDCAITIETTRLDRQEQPVHRPVCNCGWAPTDRPGVTLWYQDKRDAKRAGARHHQDEPA